MIWKPFNLLSKASSSSLLRSVQFDVKMVHVVKRGEPEPHGWCTFMLPTIFLDSCARNPVFFWYLSGCSLEVIGLFLFGVVAGR